MYDYIHDMIYITSYHIRTVDAWIERCRHSGRPPAPTLAHQHHALVAELHRIVDSE